MKKIASFTVDHDKLSVGVYISRIDGDITTFDLRFIKPNTPPFLKPYAMHTIEHLFATYARNSEYSDNVIYFGPMGCMTGFYFLTRDLELSTALELIKDKQDEHKILFLKYLIFPLIHFTYFLFKFIFKILILERPLLIVYQKELDYDIRTN